MQEKLTELESLLRRLGSVVVAFSGGVDSAFVLKVAVDVLADRAVGLTAVGPALSKHERLEAERIARRLGARHIVAESREIQNPEYVKNSGDRCYLCKSDMYALAAEHRKKLGFAHVVDGATRDDLDDFRPGLEAARQSGVRSPLLEVGLGKAEVRELARQTGLEFWDKPASACLASRIPYGTEITAERLGRVEHFEAALRKRGLKQVRVRFHHETARIEVAKEEMEAAFALREAIVKDGLAAGFTFIALDLAGYRAGSLNALLKKE